MLHLKNQDLISPFPVGCSLCSFLCTHCWILLLGTCGSSCQPMFHTGICLSSLWNCSVLLEQLHLALLQGWDESAEFLSPLFPRGQQECPSQLVLPAWRHHCFRRDEKYWVCLSTAWKFGINLIYEPLCCALSLGFGLISSWFVVLWGSHSSEPKLCWGMSFSNCCECWNCET